MTSSRRLLIVGHGRMGQLVESLCPEYGFEAVAVIDRALSRTPERWPHADVAVDFSTAEAVPVNVLHLAERGVAVVLGTTGWQNEEALKNAVTAHGIGVVAAPNFAVGVNIFIALAERAAELTARYEAFGAWIHELHHAAKRDAPSGTALALERALRRGGLERSVPIASTRAGSIPGTHTIGFDAPAETITMTHEARDRSAFARGALEAAHWIIGKRGWFSMRDVLDVK